MATVIKDIPASFETNEVPNSYLKYSFVAGCGVYLLVLPFVRGNRTFWDIMSAKRVMKYLRILVMLEILCLVLLLYYTIGYGNPLKVGYGWVIARGVSWLYSYPRPIVGIILIGFGMAADVHIMIRIWCIFGTIFQIVEDSISAVQVHLYYTQVDSGTANGGKYTSQDMYNYFMRDVISFGLCSTICLLTLHLTILLGIQWHQIYSYSTISGGDLDRCEIMRQQRIIRKSPQPLLLLESKI